MVENSTVGGMEIFRPPRTESFFMLSLPEIGGTRIGGADVVERLVGADELRHLVGAVGRLLGEHGSGQQKLSRPAIWPSLPPTLTTRRTASSITLAIIA